MRPTDGRPEEVGDGEPRTTGRINQDESEPVYESPQLIGRALGSVGPGQVVEIHAESTAAFQIVLDGRSVWVNRGAVQLLRVPG